jgi:predicted small lipoprotein YifL
MRARLPALLLAALVLAACGKYGPPVRSAPSAAAAAAEVAPDEPDPDERDEAEEAPR